MQKNIEERIFWILAFILLNPTTFVFALEVPNGPCSNTNDLPSCVNSLFQWGISFGVGIAFVSFAIGAVGFIMAGASPNLASEGKERMRNALLGVVILGGAFAILKTIDTKLINPTLNELEAKEVTNDPIPGVYFYEETGCSGTSYFSSELSIEKMNPNVKSFKIVNSKDGKIKYGVLMHKSPGLINGGECKQPKTDEGCESIGDFNGAADVFQINQDSKTSGDGIIFYNKPFGWAGGARAKSQKIERDEINAPFLKKSESLASSAYNTSSPSTGSGSDFAISSIGIRGKYLVAVYSGDYCQTFIKNVTNVKMEAVANNGLYNTNGEITNDQTSVDIIIIPTVGNSRETVK